VVPLYYQLT